MKLKSECRVIGDAEVAKNVSGGEMLVTSIVKLKSPTLERAALDLTSSISVLALLSLRKFAAIQGLIS